MPTLRFVNTLAAAETVANLLAGSKFEYLPVPAAISVFSCAAVDGVDMECSTGNVVETDSLELPRRAANTGPLTNEDRVAAFVGSPGDRLQVKLFNRAGGAGAVVRTLIEIRPL